MIRRTHWSFSAINQYLACPLRFYFQRVLCLPQRTVGSGLVLGSAVHTALAEYHRGIQAHHAPGKDRLHASFHEGWESREAESQVSYKEGESKSDHIAQGIALLEIYLQEPPPENIVTVEQEILAPIHNSQGEFLETPLVAVADLVTQQDSGLTVNEFKTSGRAYSAMEADTSIQPTCYANAVQEVFGVLPQIEYTVLVKTKTPKVQHISTVRTEEDLGRLGDIVQNVERAVQANIFYPVESPLNCSTCPFRGPCLEWGRPARVPELATADTA